jgi:hypothetical protein
MLDFHYQVGSLVIRPVLLLAALCLLFVPSHLAVRTRMGRRRFRGTAQLNPDFRDLIRCWPNWVACLQATAGAFLMAWALRPPEHEMEAAIWSAVASGVFFGISMLMQGFAGSGDRSFIMPVFFALGLVLGTSFGLAALAGVGLGIAIAGMAGSVAFLLPSVAVFAALLIYVFSGNPVVAFLVAVAALLPCLYPLLLRRVPTFWAAYPSGQP